MEMVIPGIVFKAECHYAKEVVFYSNTNGLEKGDRVLVNPWGGSEIESLQTKKNRFLVIEQRDILVKL